MNKLVWMVAVVVAFGLGYGVSFIGRGEDETEKIGCVETSAGLVLPNNFPFKIYPGDFLIPLNRFCLPGGELFVDQTMTSEPRGAFGTAEVCGLAFVFVVEDSKEMKKHYFLAGGWPGDPIKEVQYLGDNLTDMKRQYGGPVLSIGYHDPRMTNKVITTFGGEGATTTQLEWNYDYANTEYIRTYKLMPMCDDYEVERNDTSWIDGISAKRFMMEFRKAILKDQRKLVARMIDFPMTTRINGFKVCIRSQKEFLDKYDQIIDKDLREKLKAPFDEIYSVFGWRGPEMCNGRIWLRCGIGGDDSVQTTLIERVLSL